METLLRPAKQLAEWDSPFAQSLEKYLNLLKQSQSVNFGETALVIQNSSNVYARRVEYLSDEIESLNQSLLSQNEKATTEDTAQKNKYKKSKTVDFTDFELLKLHDNIGKCTNLKEGRQKAITLLTRRFTQLENNSSSPIEILTIHGEVIGNKYDFRCNQQLTKNCMLVDELTPHDFAVASSTAVPNNTSNTSMSSNIIQDSGYTSIFEHNESTATLDSIDAEPVDTDVNPCASNTLEKTCNIPKDIDAGYTSGDATEDTNESRITRNKANRNSTSTANTVDSQVLQPIPFKNGVPDTIPKRRTNFKLPCHISLLNTKAESRKRKSTSESKKRERLTQLLLDKYDMVHKKLKIYSPTRQLFTPLKLEEFEEFQRTFKQYLKSIRGSEAYHYDAVTTGVTMELLGFKPNFTKLDPLKDNHTCAPPTMITESLPIVEPESDLSSVPDSFTTPPPTPEAANPVLNYKELVGQRMKQITEESKEQSDLEERVTEWHKSLRPKLAAAVRRPPFHIHEYSSRIIKSLEVAESKRLRFNNLVQHQKAPEVARYFLATLQLANNHDVAIKTDSSSIELKLLG